VGRRLDPLLLSPVTTDLEEAREWFESLPEAMGIEGLVVKGAGSRYVGDQRGWLKGEAARRC
jgi:ATP-dependent DNA ligase